MLMIGIAILICGTNVAGAATWTVHPTAAADYTTIQAAIAAATTVDGDSIEVWNSTYTENVVVNKRLTIYSRDGVDVTIVDGGNSDSCFDVATDWVNITGFTTTNADAYDAGIYLTNADHCNISGNNVSYNNDYGIRVYGMSTGGDYNTITGNTVKHNGGHGIQIYYGEYNIVTGNTLRNNDGASKGGVYLTQSNYNTISDNIASYNYYGIGLYASTENDVTGNTVRDNSKYGIRLYDADDNEIVCNWVADNDEVGFHLTGGTSGSTGNNISCNNIMGNGVYNATSGGYEWNFDNDQSEDVDAKHNYWVATDNATIDASIYDDDEDSGRGEVTFYPFETGTVPCAPIPELATFALVGAGLAMVVGLVRFRRER